MRADGVDPNYPVSAETIGITFAKSMGWMARLDVRQRATGSGKRADF
jgi:hypothetical protein